jgi:S1-C subfamily serine protease
MKKFIRGAGTIAALAAVLAVAVAVAVMTVRPAAAQVQPRVIVQGAGTASIGVTIRDVTLDDASKARLSAPAGVYVESVREGSPAARAGFQAGDIVVDFDGERVRSASHFTRLVQESVVDRQVAAVVVRGTSKQTLNVAPEASTASNFILRSLPQPNAQRATPREFNFELDRGALRFALPATGATLGVSVTPLSDQLASFFGVTQGVLVNEVTSGSPAAAAGVRAGDVLTAINGETVTSAADITRTLRARRGESVEISVTRDRKSQTLKATIPTGNPPGGRSGRGGLPV